MRRRGRKKKGKTGTPLPKREAMSEMGIAGRLRKAWVGQFAGSSVSTASYLQHEGRQCIFASMVRGAYISFPMNSCTANKPYDVNTT